MGDKAINSAEAKFGFDKDGKYDKYEEKGSDALRTQVEKRSGKDIPDKVRDTLTSGENSETDDRRSSATRPEA